MLAVFVFDPAGGAGELTVLPAVVDSVARFSLAPSTFPPDVAASSVIQMSASGKREFKSSRICGQKLRSLIAVMSGVATLSSAAACFLSVSSRASAVRMVSFFCWSASVLCAVIWAARV